MSFTQGNEISPLSHFARGNEKRRSLIRVCLCVCICTCVEAHVSLSPCVGECVAVSACWRQTEGPCVGMCNACANEWKCTVYVSTRQFVCVCVRIAMSAVNYSTVEILQ